MKKALKRALDRLRTEIDGRFRKPTAVRGGLQRSQRMQSLNASARTSPHRRPPRRAMRDVGGRGRS